MSVSVLELGVFLDIDASIRLNYLYYLQLTLPEWLDAGHVTSHRLRVQKVTTANLWTTKNTS